MVSIKYLKLNGAIIIDNEAIEILGKSVCKNKLVSFYEPSEIPYKLSLFYNKREEENQAFMTEIADNLHLNPIS